jgi:signal transduction histidine kinase/CheY-like chemotaxis protein
MSVRILLVALSTEADVVLARKRTRRLAELIGFDGQDQVRITTAVSELARNAIDYAQGGRIEFRLLDSGRPQTFEIAVSDKGPGIADLAAVLSGSRVSPTGMGVGLRGAQRLMDRFSVETGPGRGTTVWIAKTLPARAPLVTPAVLRQIAETMAADGPGDAMEEIRQQNRLIMLQLDELRDRQSELERLNQELQDTNRGVVALYAELDDRADHLRRADELKSKFLSHMSHEFRTPLNSILALSRLLLGRSDGDLTAEQETQVRFIRRAAENLTELVDDLLDLAKAEAGKLVVSPSLFTIDSLFGTLRGMLRPLLVGDSVALLFEDRTALPELETDEGKLSQILRNFISNALKFTEHGEVRVFATMDPANDTVTFSVRDTGIGIAPENIELIFQEFAQVTHRLQSRVKGTGLGLPLARKLAELLGGHIDVVSTVGVGSTFSVTLPRCVHRAAVADRPDAVWTVEAGKVPVLVIEDDPVDAFTIERHLKGTRYQMLHVGSIGEAQAALKQIRPAAVLLDVVVLRDESWRLLLQLRQSDVLAHVPVVVVSSTGDEQKALHLGADEYIRKPVKAEQLLPLLDHMTGARPIVDVLLVDDDAIARDLVLHFLPRARFRVRQAVEGADALRQARDELPDVVLLDLNMPGMNGFELLAELEDDAALRDIPAIVLTGAVLDSDERSQLCRGRTLLPKAELSPQLLIEAIARAVGPRSAGAARARHGPLPQGVP